MHGFSRNVRASTPNQFEMVETGNSVRFLSCEAFKLLLLSLSGDLDVAFDLEAASMRPAHEVMETRITQNAPVCQPPQPALPHSAFSCCHAPALLAAQAPLLLTHPEPLMGR